MRRTLVVTFSSSDSDSEDIPVVPIAVEGQNDATEIQAKPDPEYSYYYDEEEATPEPVQGKKQETIEKIDPTPGYVPVISGESVPPPTSVISCPRKQPPLNRSYSISRLIKQTVKGKRYFFRMMEGERDIFHSKATARYPKGRIPVTSERDVHMTSNCEHWIDCSVDHSTFTLLTSTGQTLVKYEVMKEPIKYLRPHYFRVEIGPSLGYHIPVIASKRPVMNEKGQWTLDFHNKFTIASVKNAIFVEASERCRDGIDLMMVRKSSDDTISVDIFSPVPELAIFAVAMATFLCKL